MRTIIAPRWEEVSIESRMEVYDAYLAQDNDFGFGTMSFEEFNEACRFSTFKYVKSLYMGA